MVKVSSLKLNDKNPRQIRDERFEKLKRSIDAFPQMMELRPIIVDEHGVVLGGNMRLRAIKALGLKEIPDAWVKRADELTDDQKREFVIKDNNSFGEYDWDAIANEWSDLPLDEWGVDVPEFLAVDEQGEPGDAEPQIDKAAELNKKWKVKSGDLWQIGEHRLLCGDSTKREDVERVVAGETIDAVATDPPYGVGVDYETFHDSEDNASNVALDVMPILLSLNCPVALTPGVPVMWQYPQPAWVMVWIHPAPVGGCVWGFAGVNPILVYGKDPYLANGKGRRPDHIVMAADREGVDGHPTPKPPKVWDWLIERVSVNRGDKLFEPFAGSGTTLVACQNLNRKCYAIEISENYCAVILERMQTAFPDIEIKRLDDAKSKAKNNG